MLSEDVVNNLILVNRSKANEIGILWSILFMYCSIFDELENGSYGSLFEDFSGEFKITNTNY